MYRVCKQFKFEAAHWGKHKGKLSIHGHSFRAELFFTVRCLSPANLVVSPERMSKITTEALGTFDGSFLISRTQAEEFPSLASHDDARLLLFDFTPTTDTMAHVIFSFIKRLLHDSAGEDEGKHTRLELEKVRIHDEEGSWVEYEPTLKS